MNRLQSSSTVDENAETNPRVHDNNARTKNTRRITHRKRGADVRNCHSKRRQRLLRSSRGRPNPFAKDYRFIATRPAAVGDHMKYLS